MSGGQSPGHVRRGRCSVAKPQLDWARIDTLAGRDVAEASSRGQVLSSQDPLEARGPFGLHELDDLVADDLQARRLDQAPVLGRLEAGEERLGPEPLACPAGVVRDAERVERQPARPQPAGDPLEQRAEMLARHVVEDVERADRVEGAGRQLELEKVRLDELGPGHSLAGTPELLGGDVDAGQPEAPRELQRLLAARAAAELEDACPVRESRHQLLRPLRTRIAFDLVLPAGEAVGDAVITALDDLHARVRHSTSTSISSAPASARAAASPPVSPSAIT